MSEIILQIIVWAAGITGAIAVSIIGYAACRVSNEDDA